VNVDLVAIADSHHDVLEEPAQILDVAHTTSRPWGHEAAIHVEVQEGYIFVAVATRISSASAHGLTLLVAGLNNLIGAVAVGARDMVGGLDAATREVAAGGELAKVASREPTVESPRVHEQRRPTGRILIGVLDKNCMIQRIDASVVATQLTLTE
jgi:hypothetical protein